MDWNEFSTKKLHQYFDIGVDQAAYIIPRLFIAFIILWIGFKMVKRLGGFIEKGQEKLGITHSLRPFITSLIKGVLKVLLFMVVAKIIGADITGLIALFATAGFAIGLALQGSLGNFASGILILSLRPYKTGDWVLVEDKFGKVEEIGIFNTRIVTPGAKILIIPNSKITDTIVTNYSEKGKVRLELEIDIPYEESYPKVEKIIKNTLAEIPVLLKEPKPEVGIVNFDSHTVTISIKPFVKPDEYWPASYEFNAAIKKALHANNIRMAYAEGVELGPVGE